MSKAVKWCVRKILLCSLLLAGALSACSQDVSEQITLNNFEKLGGTELLLEIDMENALDQELDNLKDTIRQEFRSRDRLRPEFIRVDGHEVLIRLRKSEDMSRAREAIKNLNSEFNSAQLFSGEAFSMIVIGEKQFRLAYTQDYISYSKKRLTVQSVNVLRKRNKTVQEPLWSVQLLGEEQIILRIPASANSDDVQKNMRRQGNLSFHVVRKESNNAAAMDLATRRGMVPSGAVFYPDANGGSGLIVERKTKITSECLKSASDGLHPMGNYPIINFTFNIDCAKIFGKMTQRNIGQRFAIVLDGTIITAPRINGAITGGSGFIEGNFTSKEAKELAQLLNSGPLPAKFKIIKETTIKPKT